MESSSHLTFTTTKPLWRYTAETASWFFVTLDKKLSNKIKKADKKANGWGQRKVEVTVGKTTWQTSLFPGKLDTYVLPIKSQVRKAETIREGDNVKLKITLI